MQTQVPLDKNGAIFDLAIMHLCSDLSDFSNFRYRILLKIYDIGSSNHHT